MIDLFIDIGNSRIKFAASNEDEYDYLGARLLPSSEDRQALMALLSDLDITPDQVFVSSVTSAHFEHGLREAIASVWSVFPVFFTTQLECCGLRNGYADPLQLGVDRWMALIAARSLTASPFLVVDAGTAITLDAVHNERHLGGFIVPGIATMRESLGLKAARLPTELGELSVQEGGAEASSLFATDTQTGICVGTLYMAASFINSAVSELHQEVGQQPKVFITGGDGSMLSELVNVESEYIEDMVLLGMLNIKESVKK